MSAPQKMECFYWVTALACRRLALRMFVQRSFECWLTLRYGSRRATWPANPCDSLVVKCVVDRTLSPSRSLSEAAGEWSIIAGVARHFKSDPIDVPIKVRFLCR